MEIFIDFGLFELLGIFALAKLARVALHRFRGRLAGSSAKLGRCIRCMTITAIGLSACSVAAVWVGPPASPFLRWPVYVAWLAFMTLAVLHVLAMLYRALTRLESRVASMAGGCNCSGPPDRTVRRG
jgi:hypothetical protein